MRYNARTTSGPSKMVRCDAKHEAQHTTKQKKKKKKVSGRTAWAFCRDRGDIFPPLSHSFTLHLA